MRHLLRYRHRHDTHDKAGTNGVLLTLEELALDDVKGLPAVLQAARAVT